MALSYRGAGGTGASPNTAASRLSKRSRFFDNLQGKYNKYWRSQMSTGARASDPYQRRNNPYARQQAEAARQQAEQARRMQARQARRAAERRRMETERAAAEAREAERWKNRQYAQQRQQMQQPSLPWWQRLILGVGRAGASQYYPSYSTQVARVAAGEPYTPPPTDYDFDYGPINPANPSAHIWMGAKQRQNAQANRMADYYQRLADENPGLARTMVPSYANALDPDIKALLWNEQVYPQDDLTQMPGSGRIQDVEAAQAAWDAYGASRDLKSMTQTEEPMAEDELPWDEGYYDDYYGDGGYGYPTYPYPSYGGGGDYDYPVDQRPAARQGVPVGTAQTEERRGYVPREQRTAYYRKRLAWLGI